MRLPRLAWIGCLLLVAGCSRSEKQPATTPISLRICTGTSYSVLVTIAQQKGLFAKEGLAVQLLPFALGRDAMESMLADNCEVATSADTPVADYGRSRHDLRVIAGIAKSDRLCYIVARQGSGIGRVADLKGHQVGVSKGTAPHFFLDLLLNKNRLTEKDVQLKFMKGEELNLAMRSGLLAAIATTDLNALRLQQELGRQVLLIEDPGIALNHGYLTLKETTLQMKQDALRRMMRALLAADRLAAANPEEAKELFAAYLKVGPQVTDRLWESVTPRLCLEPAMILTLEDNARWLREREGSPAVQRSFKEVINPALLREVAPDRVTMN